MKLNEIDSRAVEMLLNGLQGHPDGSAAAGAADGTGRAGTFTGNPPAGSAPSGVAGATSAVSAMSDDLAKRVTHVDDMLRLLDYLPTEEPPASLVQRTIQRIEEARLQARIPAHGGLGAGAPPARPAAGYNPGIARSPGDEGDAATL